MKTTLEYNGQPVEFKRPATRCGSFLMLGNVVVPRGALVSACAWCDRDKALTKQLSAAGYEVSHGICQPCLANHYPHVAEQCDICKEVS